ncbi:hypothetical protein DXC43_18560, partial [Subdoligranulum sp. TF05-17AC]
LPLSIIQIVFLSGKSGMGHFRLLEMCGRVTRTDTAGRGGKPCPVFLLDKGNGLVMKQLS